MGGLLKFVETLAWLFILDLSKNHHVKEQLEIKIKHNLHEQQVPFGVTRTGSWWES